VSFVQASILALVAAFFLMPAWLLRRQPRERARDFFVSSPRISADVVRNASIAYAVRASVLGPCFALGAIGEFWPVLLAAASFAAGVCLLYVLRRPILSFIDGALARDGSVTVHAFVARQHGNNARLRLLAAVLSVATLLAFLAGEAFLVKEAVEPSLLDGAAPTYLLPLCMLALAMAGAAISGAAGALHAMQLQLGLTYLCFYASAALLLYLQVASVTDAAPARTLATLLIVALSATFLWYRRTKYVETSRLGTTGRDQEAPRTLEAAIAGLLRRFGKILNPLISALVVFVLVICAMQLFSSGAAAIVREAVAALTAGSRAPFAVLAGVALAGFFYPLVDVANWQRIAALRQDAGKSARSPAEIKGALSMYALEAPLMWMLTAMLGAVAMAQGELSGASLRELIPQLAAQKNAIASAAHWCLMLTVLSAATAAMTGLFSAVLCTLRYDLMPALWPRLKRDDWGAQEAAARRGAIVIAVALGLAALLILYAADAAVGLAGGKPTFLLAFLGLQLALAPVTAVAIIRRERRDSRSG
jgi:hypothetical protein